MEPNLVKKSGFTENTVRKQKKILVIAVICVITLFIGTSYSLLTNFDTKNDNNVLSFENINVNQYANSEANNKVNQDSMDLRLKQLYIEELEKDVISKVEENGYTVSDCTVEANLDEDAVDRGINKIEIKILGRNKNNKIEEVNEIQEIKIDINSNSDGNEKDISNEELKNLRQVLSEYYQVSLDVITVYY